MARVLVIDSDYDSAGTAIERALEAFPLDVRGKSVLVKPNILGSHPPDRHVDTHPAVVAALVSALEARGARVAVGDNPGVSGYGEVERCARASGLLEASRGTFVNLARDTVMVDLPGRGEKVNVSKLVLDADVLISVPKFKTHTLTGMTGAIKNSFGHVVGGNKARLHMRYGSPKRFSEMLVDVYRIRVPDLVIMDAVVGMQGNGPSAKTLYDVGKIIASDDGVALDAVAARMMGFHPHRVRMLSRAAELGLGAIDPSSIEVSGEAGRLGGFSRPVPAVPRLLGTGFIRVFFPDSGRPRFDVAEAACNSCGTCAGACPAGAIELSGGVPGWDYSRCIACYCCMELCPRQAIARHPTARTRALLFLRGHRADRHHADGPAPPGISSP